MDDHEDPELDKALAELLEQTRKEPVSPRLRDLADRLSQALAAAQRRRDSQDADGQ